MKEIDLKNWNRASHYELFGSYLQPCFRLDVRLDVTKLVENKNELGGLFAPLCYLVTRALNKYDGGRIRETNDGKLVIYDKVEPSFTVSLDDGNFAFCICEYDSDYKTFLSRYEEVTANTKAQAQKGESGCFETNNRADVIYLSCLPWLDFVSIENPLPLGNKLSMSIPRINWGKLVKTEKGYEVTLSATFNHAYIDGREASDILNTIIYDLARIDELK